ncbi:hypothetical protein LP421_00775 (plasmid) [Rhizobium sp. RCAM05350]|nr:hypothetical protein LP421_00775 [Rhizobium sp. RCAM05350]
MSGASTVQHSDRDAAQPNLSRAFTQTEIKEALQTIEQTRPLLDTLFSDVRLSGAATFGTCRSRC